MATRVKRGTFELPPTWIEIPEAELRKLPKQAKQRGGKSGHTRGHRGAGSVYQRSDGLWVAQVRLGGKVRRAYARDWNAADEKLRRLRATVGPTQPHEAQTVADFAEAWLFYEEHQERHWRSLKPTTIRGYRQLLRDYALPAIGHREISGPWVRADFDFLSDRRLPGNDRQPESRKTLHNLRAVTRRLFSQAVAWDRLAANPIEKSWWPSGYKARSGGQTLTSTQAHELIEAAWRVSPNIAPILALLLYTGARLGEVLALRWGAVQLAPAPSIEIRETLTRKIDKGMGFDTPKTPRSRRRIWLNDEAARLIADLPSREQANEQTLLFPSPYKPRDDEGRERPYGWQMPISPSHVYHELQRSLKEAGLPKVRVHDLRHTAASLMLASGIETVTVSAVLGHASPSITHDMYSHVVPGRDREAVNVLTFGQETLRSPASAISTKTSTTKTHLPRSNSR